MKKTISIIVLCASSLIGCAQSSDARPEKPFFRVGNDDLNFLDAQHACEAAGGALAVADSQEDVQGILDACNAEPPTDGGYRICWTATPVVVHDQSFVLTVEQAGIFYPQSAQNLDWGFDAVCER